MSTILPFSFSTSRSKNAIEFIDRGLSLRINQILEIINKVPMLSQIIINVYKLIKTVHYRVYTRKKHLLITNLPWYYQMSELQGPQIINF